MKYNFDSLNTYDFESLIQSLVRVLIGNGTISFGQGPDGGREAIFEGKAPYPSLTENWDGYWIVQAKFKTVDSEKGSTDFNWLKTQLEKECNKFKSRKVKIKKPDNYLFFTNIRLSSVATAGSRDKATKLERSLEKIHGIKNVRIISYDDLVDFLNLNRDIATGFASFILPNDIIFKLYELLLGNKSKTAKKVNDAIIRFLEVEFKDNAQSKLDHAGKLTSDKVNLDKVFIDLDIKTEGLKPISQKRNKFISRILNEGDSSLRPENKRTNKFVLVAGPGYGKSTLTQLLSQVYRSNFLISLNNETIGITQFNKEIISEIRSLPKCARFPVTIVLKKYAEWIKERRSAQLSSTVIDYLISKINLRNSDGGGIILSEFEDLLTTISFLFVFDGLDEVPITSNRKDVLDEIIEFTEIDIRKYNTDALIVATTRPQGYTKEFDPEQYSHLQIDDLNSKECIRYIEKLINNLEGDEERKKTDLNILKQAIENPIVSRLMKTPLQASIMTILVKSGGEPPRNKYDLFVEYYNVVLKREKQKDVAKILKEHDMYVKDIHDRVGFHLQVISENDSNPAAAISLEVFDKIIKDYLEENGLDQFEKTRISGEIQKASTDRLVFISEIEEGRIGFAIRSVQEYFAANYYLHNQKDEIIPDRLKAISKPSYWSNTLMFGLGYITKNKKYLLDGFESFCRELNGSAEINSVSSAEALSFTGTWLAVDIVNEGVFRAIPRIENKFVNLITSTIFSIAYQDKHKELIKLPQTIRKVCVDDQLSAMLNNSFVEANRTAWRILIELVLNGDNDAVRIFIKNWPFEKTQQCLLGELIFDSELYLHSPEIQERFIKSIINLNDFNVLKLLVEESNFELCKLILRTEAPIEFKRNLFELIFFAFIKDNNHNRFALLIESLKSYKTDSVNGKMKFEVGDDLFLRFECKFSDEYSLNTHSCHLQLNPVWDVVQSYCQSAQLTLINSFFTLANTPQKASIIEFLDQLKEITCEEKFNLIADSLRFKTWIFHEIFVLNNDLSQSIFVTLNDTEVSMLIDSHEKKLMAQASIEQLDREFVKYYYEWNSTELTIEVLKQLQEISEYDFDDPKSRSKALDFLIGATVDFFKKRQKDVETYQSIVETIFKKFTTSTWKYRDYQILLFQILFDKYENVIEIISNKEHTFLDSDIYIESGLTTRLLERSAFESLVTYVNKSCVLMRNFRIIKVLANVLSTLAKEKIRCDTSNLQYPMYEEIELSETTLKASMIIILLSNENISHNGVQVVMKHFTEMQSVDTQVLFRIMDVISLYNGANNKLLQLLLALDKKVHKADIQCRNKFELMLRAYVGATKSNLKSLV